MKSSLPVGWKLDESELEALGRAGVSGMKSSLPVEWKLDESELEVLGRAGVKRDEE
ncbi:hypothetical protein NSS64_03540 [Paenibacillus sp. FSL H8-0122]|uniref:hypothetical protein n=1 Tax=Paenibacillus sp. FSL H8-0122 TaxID=2954510 RepID=UPI0030FABA4A